MLPVYLVKASISQSLPHVAQGLCYFLDQWTKPLHDFKRKLPGFPKIIQMGLFTDLARWFLFRSLCSFWNITLQKTEDTHRSHQLCFKILLSHIKCFRILEDRRLIPSEEWNANTARFWVWVALVLRWLLQMCVYLYGLWAGILMVALFYGAKIFHLLPFKTNTLREKLRWNNMSVYLKIFKL